MRRIQPLLTAIAAPNVLNTAEMSDRMTEKLLMMTVDQGDENNSLTGEKGDAGSTREPGKNTARGGPLGNFGLDEYAVIQIVTKIATKISTERV